MLDNFLVVVAGDRELEPQRLVRQVHGGQDRDHAVRGAGHHLLAVLHLGALDRLRAALAGGALLLLHAGIRRLAIGRPALGSSRCRRVVEPGVVGAATVRVEVQHHHAHDRHRDHVAVGVGSLQLDGLAALLDLPGLALVAEGGDRDAVRDVRAQLVLRFGQVGGKGSARVGVPCGQGVVARDYSHVVHACLALLRGGNQSSPRASL